MAFQPLTSAFFSQLQPLHQEPGQTGVKAWPKSLGHMAGLAKR